MNYQFSNFNFQICRKNNKTYCLSRGSPRYSFGEVGQTLVELLVAIGLSTLFIPVLLTGMVAARSGRAQDDQRTQAVALVKEAAEAVRVIRNRNWNTLAAFPTNQALHPIVLGNTWTATTGAELINGFGFTRQIVINPVYRDSSGNIASSGTLDLSTKKVVITVSWTTPLSSSVSETEYLTRNTNNAYIETTQNDFLKGATASGKLAITNTSGGEVTLGSGSGAGDDWCNPGNSTLATSALVRNGIPFAISATTSASTDHLYVTTGNNASGYVAEVLSVDHNSPPNVTVGNEYNVGKGYGVYVDHDGGYAYVAETTKTVEILDASTMAQVSYFDIGGSSTGNSTFVKDGIGYVTVSLSGNSEKLYTFNASTINIGGSQALLGSVSLAAKGNKVIVIKDSSGNTYAFVAEASSSKQLEIFQVTNGGATLTPVANAQISNAASGQDVFVNAGGTRAYLVTNQYVVGQKQFFILDTHTKSGVLPAPLGSFDTYSQATLSAGMNPKGVTVVSGNKAIVVGSQTGGLGQQYQVYNIASESAIKYCGGASNTVIPNGVDVNAISSLYRSDQTAYSYILRSDQTVQIIQGGNGAAFSFNGTFESGTFTAAMDSMFNTFTTTTSVPSTTTLQFQVAIKHANGSGNCTGVTFSNGDFVGPDGLSTSYFPATGGILPGSSDGSGYENPGQCLRYRVTMASTDITQSPELYDVTFNYSP